MPYNPDKHHRRSIRLRGYDYAERGAYFVTMSIQHRAYLLGDVVHGQMRCTDAGAMVWHWWRALPEKFPSVAIDAFVVMPDHLHGIIVLGENGGRLDESAHAGAPQRGEGGEDGEGSEGGEAGGEGSESNAVGADRRVGPQRRATPGPEESNAVGADRRVGPQRSATTSPAASAAPHAGPPTLGTVVQWLKTMTTNAYIRGVRDHGWPPFDGRLWQRNYYEHIVRDAADLARIRAYIERNPARWGAGKGRR